MKRFLPILLVLTVLLMLSACGNTDDNKVDSNNADSNITDNQFYFIAKVVELYEQSMLIEVTDKGNCGVNIGNQITVSTEKIAGVLANDATMVTDNYLRIECDGLILESYPLQLSKVFKIDITNKKGESIE